MDLTVIENEVGVKFGQKLYWLNVFNSMNGDGKQLIQIERDRSGVFKVAVDDRKEVYVETEDDDLERLES